MFGSRIVGQRVVLSTPIAEYIPTYLRWLADPETTRYLKIQHPPSAKMEHEWFETMAASPADVLWTVLIEDRLVGSTGLHNIDWRNRHCHSGTVIGEKDAWRQGVASETIALRTRYAFLELGLEKVKTSVALPNHASIRALEKSGYRQVGILRHEWHREGRWIDHWVGEVLREEWLARFSP